MSSIFLFKFVTDICKKISIFFMYIAKMIQLQNKTRCNVAPPLTGVLYSVQPFLEAEGTLWCGPLTEALRGPLKMTWPDLQMKDKYAAVWTSVMGMWEEADRLGVLNHFHTKLWVWFTLWPHLHNVFFTMKGERF